MNQIPVQNEQNSVKEKIEYINKSILDVNITKTHKKRKSMAFIGNIINTLNEGHNSVERDKENQDNLDRLYEEQRRIRKTQELKKFIKVKRSKHKTTYELFEKNKTFFQQNKITLLKLIDYIREIDKEEKEEKMRKRKEIKEKDKAIKKEIDLTIIAPIKFKNYILAIDSNINKLDIQKTNNYNKISKLCHKTNEYNVISGKVEYFKNRSKSYKIKSLNKEEIIRYKKIKYDLSELIISLNEINIICFGIENKKEYKSQNGIDINDLRINKKRKDNNLSKLKKIEKIMQKIENENIMKKIIKEKKIPLNCIFCINCKECFDIIEKDKHKEHFTVKVDDFKIEEEDLDSDEKLNIIYQNLKKSQKKIIKYGNKKIIKYYGKLLFSLYDIIMNNNSYEELYLSIININKDYIYELESGTFSEIFKNLFLLFCQKISQLTYLKAKELSFFELGEEIETKSSELDDDILFEQKIENNKN